MVKIKKGSKTYMLNKAEFQKYMFNLWKTAQAKKQARKDIKEEQGKA